MTYVTEAPEIHFERIAVTRAQIEHWRLPSGPTKATDSRAKSFGSDVSVELDAINRSDLRSLVRTCIENHLPREQFEILKVAEESERQLLKSLVRRLK